jgi:hypothetical protein
MVRCAGLSEERSCSWALYRREGSPFWWVRCYVDGERGRVRRWSTGVRTDDPRGRAKAVAVTIDSLADPLSPMRTRHKRHQKIRTIYFVRSGDKVKIGIAGDLDARLAKMRCDSAAPMELLGSRPGGLGEERALHARLSAHRSHGEWFHAAPEVLAEVTR